jgi:hypothetical protein
VQCVLDDAGKGQRVLDDAGKGQRKDAQGIAEPLRLGWFRPVQSAQAASLDPFQSAHSSGLQPVFCGKPFKPGKIARVAVLGWFGRLYRSASAICA